MLAISHDRFTDPNAPLKCQTYRDLVAKIQELADMVKDAVLIKQDIVWLADQIRMRYRLEPIGIYGSPSEPHLVLGTGYVPQAVIWHGSRDTTKGKSIEQFNFMSLNIENAKGDEHIMRSSDVKTLARRLKADMLTLVDISDDFYQLDFINHEIHSEVSVGGKKNYVPYMDESVRLEVFNYFRSVDKTITPGITTWLDEKRGLVEANEKFLRREDYIREAFLKRSIMLYELPMLAEYKYFLQGASYSATDKCLVPTGERVFFSDINDLTDFPHVIGVNNMLRMKDKNTDIFCTSGAGFLSEFNYFRFHSGSAIFDKRFNYVVFPAERIPSESEMLGAQEVKTNVATESSLSVLNF